LFSHTFIFFHPTVLCPGGSGGGGVNYLIDRYFTADVVGDGTSVLPEISETQSQSVDGTEPVTQDWMVPDQIAADNERKRQKAIAMVNRFEKEHKEKQDQKENE